MSKQTRDFLKELKEGQQPSLLENIKEAAGSLKDMGGQVWDNAKPLFDHGRTELAAALFAGHAHVMYMRGQDGVEHDQVQGKDEPQQQQEAGSRDI